MTSKNSSKQSKPFDGERRDQYELVTQAIVSALEKGVAPWVCPWDKSQGMPHNGASGHVYQGINVWLCWASGHADARWYTFNQVKEYGKSSVRKGEKGTHIVKWLFLDKDETDKNGNNVRHKVPVLRTFCVFNHVQIDWEAGKEPKQDNTLTVDPAATCAEAATLIAKTGATIKHGGARACYSHSLDDINMPVPNSFASAEAYWATLLHEVTHWTGHKSRCNRDLTGRFGSESYAAEELVAELGSAFLCADLNIQGQLQHPEYIGNWIKVLSGDKYAIFTAARLAKEAVAFVAGKDGEVAAQDDSTPEVNIIVAQAA